MPGGQGGPRFPGFGVGRGFAIWGPFPVHAPDSAPETWTSLNKNLALHTALPVVDGFGGFAGFGGFVFTHGHFSFQKQRTAPVCMILMIFLEARPRAGAIKATPATDLMVFPAVPDHSRPQVRLALSCRPRLGFGSRGLVVRSLRHLPMNSLGLSTRLWDKPPPDPDIANGCRRSWLLGVVHGHRAVMRWRQPRSIHLCDEHGCVQLADAGGETTRGRVPRGVSETFEVSPTGSIPRRENPAWQVANDKVEASRAMLPCGQEAPEEKRPLTRGTVEDSRKTNRRGSQIPQPKVHGP